MDYKETAKEIVNLIGGVENISGLEHCSTRLRFSLKDDSKVNTEKLQSVKGVLKVIINSQCQIVIGNEVKEVYDEVKKITGDTINQEQDNSKGKKKVDIILDYMISIFQPLVPAIAGAGILKSLLLVLAMTPILSNESSTYQIFMNAADAALYFLPILVAYTTAKKLRVNELVAVTIVGMTILPKMLTLIGEGTSLMGFSVENITYPYQVFPAILIVLVYAQIERFLTKYTIKQIRIFFVPMVSILIMTPVALLILGPLGYNIGELITTVIFGIYNSFGWLAVALLAALLPFMVATGMHKAFIPYVVSSIGTLGYEILYNSASLCHNISEAGMCYAVAVRTKDENKKQVAISAAISATCGITEPALYGITLQNKTSLISVVLGSLISGTYIGIFAVKAFVAVGPGLPSMTMFVDPADPMNIIRAFIGFCIALGSSFVITLFLYKEDVVVEEDNVEKTEVELNNSINGEMINLDEVNDEIFSSKVMGDGFASIPASDKLLSPCNGNVEMLFETNHALGLKLENGAELLIHIGIDTVNIKEDVFTPCIKCGDKVEAGQELIKFNLNRIKELGYDPTIMYIITNTSDFIIKNEEQNCLVTRKGEDVK